MKISVRTSVNSYLIEAPLSVFSKQPARSLLLKFNWVFCQEISHVTRLADKSGNLTVVGLCVVIYFYSKTKYMHNISNLFYFKTTLYMFRKVSPSIIRSRKLYIYLMLYVQS